VVNNFSDKNSITALIKKKAEKEILISEAKRSFKEFFKFQLLIYSEKARLRA